VKREEWTASEHFRMEENFLVTGGAGFIGSSFILQQTGIRPHLSLTWTS
jgi:hypothetical protein